MTLEQLRAEVAPLADQLRAWAMQAESDDFAPWVVTALVRAARLADLPDDLLRELALEEEPEPIASRRVGP